MTKYTRAKSFDTGKLKATKLAEETAFVDFVDSMADLDDQVGSALRNGITFGDNVDCKFLDVTLVSGTAQTVNVGVKRARMIQLAQVVSVTYGLESFHWYVDSDGATKVKAVFTSSPGTAQVSVVLLIVYG